MKKSISKIAAMLLVLAGESSCGGLSDAAGTIIGNYSNGWCEILIQVDEKYPIGKDIEYLERPGNCIYLPHDGTYSNVIKVQTELPLSDFPKNETLMNKKISFSYRSFNAEKIPVYFCLALAMIFVVHRIFRYM